MQIGINTNVNTNTNTEIDNASSNKPVAPLESLLETPEVNGVAYENPVFEANNNVLESSLSASYLAATLNNLLNNQATNTTSVASSNTNELSYISSNPIYQDPGNKGNNPFNNVVAGGGTEATVQNNPLYSGVGNSGDNPVYSSNATSSNSITRTGNDSFFVNETGVITHTGNPNGVATPVDEPVQ